MFQEESKPERFCKKPSPFSHPVGRKVLLSTHNFLQPNLEAPLKLIKGLRKIVVGLEGRQRKYGIFSSSYLQLFSQMF
jgi:hypothetical protein